VLLEMTNSVSLKFNDMGAQNCHGRFELFFCLNFQALFIGLLVVIQVELLDFGQTIDESRNVPKALAKKASLALSLKTKLEKLAYPVLIEYFKSNLKV
jgi:hypothetical protein